MWQPVHFISLTPVFPHCTHAVTSAPPLPDMSPLLWISGTWERIDPVRTAPMLSSPTVDPDLAARKMSGCLHWDGHGRLWDPSTNSCPTKQGGGAQQRAKRTEPHLCVSFGDQPRAAAASSECAPADTRPGRPATPRSKLTSRSKLILKKLVLFMRVE